MTTIHRDSNYRIRVNAEHHGRPHFHVDTPDFSVSVAIDTMEILAGGKHAREIYPALEWAAENRKALLDEWNRLNR